MKHGQHRASPARRCWPRPAAGTDPAIPILERELRCREDENYRLRATSRTCRTRPSTGSTGRANGRRPTAPISPAVQVRPEAAPRRRRTGRRARRRQRAKCPRSRPTRCPNAQAAGRRKPSKREPCRTPAGADRRSRHQDRTVPRSIAATSLPRRRGDGCIGRAAGVAFGPDQSVGRQPAGGLDRDRPRADRRHLRRRGGPGDDGLLVAVAPARPSRPAGGCSGRHERGGVRSGRARRGRAGGAGGPLGLHRRRDRIALPPHRPAPSRST